MHVVTVNYYFDSFLSTPEDLLDRYRTQVAWADALTSAGAKVTVVQRFSRDAELTRDGVCYRFVHSAKRPLPTALDPAIRVNRAVVDAGPDLVHVNGLGYSRQAYRLKRALPRIPLLLQDHADHPPRRRTPAWASLRVALKCVDAVAFASAGLAQPWHDAGLLPSTTPVYELMETTCDFTLADRVTSRGGAEIEGDPVCLWVGRLNANKDPLTILRGFAMARKELPNARLYMAYGEDDLLVDVRRWLDENPAVSTAVTLLGRVPHPDLERLYNCADLFLLGSHHEGSGYSLLEALACGVFPVVTDIPSFRTITGNGEIGELWPVEDAEALGASIVRAYENIDSDTPARVRAFFDRRWSASALGRSAVDVYGRMIAEARA